MCIPGKCLGTTSVITGCHVLILCLCACEKSCFFLHFQKEQKNIVGRFSHLNPAHTKSQSKARYPAVQMLDLRLEFGCYFSQSLTSRQNNLSSFPAGLLYRFHFAFFPSKVLWAGHNGKRIMALDLLCFLHSGLSSTHPPSFPFWDHCPSLYQYPLNIHSWHTQYVNWCWRRSQRLNH